jgi:glutamine synthetase
VLQLDHEDAHGQYEINFLHDDALARADRLMLFKLAAQALAERDTAMVFSMMPKPLRRPARQRLHFHLSLT